MSNSFKSFENLEAWKQARAMTRNIYQLTAAPELSRDIGLRSQLQRAAVSIMSNLAEGFERRHVAEKLQLFNIAKGSSAEVRSLLYVIADAYPALTSQANQLREQLSQLGGLVYGLHRSTAKRRAE
jgi:four helix bundle protein